MKNRRYKKERILVILFCIIQIFTVFSVISKDLPKHVDILLEDSYEIEPFDEYEEIFTFIYGACDEVIINKEGIIQDVELYCWGTWGVELGFRGWVKPFKHIHEHGIIDIHASKFFGRIISADNDKYIIRGYAIGNIDWTRYDE